MSTLTDVVDSFMDHLLVLLQSGTFWAAAGVLATLLAAVIPLIVRNRSTSKRTAAATVSSVATTRPSPTFNPFRDEIKARIETKFSDVVDPTKVAVAASSAGVQAAPTVARFIEWFTEYKKQAGSTPDVPRMTTHQAFIEWFFSRGRNLVYNDYAGFLRVGALLEQAGYRVGPPLSAEEYHEKLKEAQEKRDTALTSLKTRRNVTIDAPHAN